MYETSLWCQRNLIEQHCFRFSDAKYDIQKAMKSTSFLKWDMTQLNLTNCLLELLVIYLTYLNQICTLRNQIFTLRRKCPVTELLILTEYSVILGLDMGKSQPDPGFRHFSDFGHYSFTRLRVQIFNWISFIKLSWQLRKKFSYWYESLDMDRKW